MTPQRLRLLAIWLGCFRRSRSVVVLALTDYHGEADVTLEWMIVRLAFGAIVAFHIAGLLALSRLRP